MLGKEEWWWIMDDVIEEIAMQLRRDNFVVIDGFLLEKQAQAIRQEAINMRREGKLNQGVLINAKNKGETYLNATMRNDEVGWFEGSRSEGWMEMPGYLVKLGTLISELGR